MHRGFWLQLVCTQLFEPLARGISRCHRGVSPSGLLCGTELHAAFAQPPALQRGCTTTTSYSKIESTLHTDSIHAHASFFFIRHLAPGGNWPKWVPFFAIKPPHNNPRFRKRAAAAYALANTRTRSPVAGRAKNRILLFLDHFFRAPFSQPDPHHLRPGPAKTERRYPSGQCCQGRHFRNILQKMEKWRRRTSRSVISGSILEKRSKKMDAAPGVPKWSPTLVLTRPEPV